MNYKKIILFTTTILCVICCNKIKKCSYPSETYEFLPFPGVIDKKNNYNYREDYYISENFCVLPNKDMENIRLSKIDTMIYENLKNVDIYKYESIYIYLFKNSDCIQKNKTWFDYDENHLYGEQGCPEDLILTYIINNNLKQKKINYIIIHEKKLEHIKSIYRKIPDFWQKNSK